MNILKGTTFSGEYERWNQPSELKENINPKSGKKHQILPLQQLRPEFKYLSIRSISALKAFRGIPANKGIITSEHSVQGGQQDIRARCFCRQRTGVLEGGTTLACVVSKRLSWGT